MKKINFILVILIFLIIPLEAKELNFDDFLTSAIINSYKLQNSTIDTKISKHSIKEAKAAYYPTINGFATTERYNDLTNGTSQITAVGNEILLNRDYYQDMAAIGASYNIFDFGARRKTLDIAKQDDKQKELILKKETRDLKLQAIDIYAQALLHYKNKIIQEKILNLNNELITINKRLKKAGEISEIDVVDSQIESSETKTRLDTTINSLEKSLSELSYYTKESYNINETTLNDFKENSISDNQNTPNATGVIKLNIQTTVFNLNNSLEAEIYNLEISKKEKEIQIQKKANFPKIRFDTRYNLYGSHPNNYIESINDLSQRSFSFRLSTSFTLFDGFKNINTIHKKKLEVEKLKIEKENELAQLRKKYEQIELDFKNAIIQSENNKTTLQLINKNLEMLSRLNTNGFVEKSQCIKKQIELLRKKQTLEENEIKNFVSRYKMQTFNQDKINL